MSGSEHNKLAQAARMAAQQRLVELHRPEYEMLEVEERAKRGLPQPQRRPGRQKSSSGPAIHESGLPSATPPAPPGASQAPKRPSAPPKAPATPTDKPGRAGKPSAAPAPGCTHANVQKMSWGKLCGDCGHVIR